MKLWTTPQLSVLARQQFSEPPHLSVEWKGLAGASERLIEYAGRLCYMSQGNASGKTTEMYLAHIMNEGHGSVLEHAVWTILFEGVSRALTHELVRHRAGMSYSQLSSRYVETEDVVVPPAVLAHGEGATASWEHRAWLWMTCYQSEIAHLEERGLTGKPLREAARAALPYCAETKLVVTGNARAWRHFITLRAAPGADAEMRRLALATLNVLKEEAPLLFGDFDDQGVPRWRKV